jgi:hypothetical protein
MLVNGMDLSFSSIYSMHVFIFTTGTIKVQITRQQTNRQYQGSDSKGFDGSWLPHSHGARGEEHGILKTT